MEYFICNFPNLSFFSEPESSGSDGKDAAHNEGDLGLIPGDGNNYHSENKKKNYHSGILSLDRGPWWATVHGVAKSKT